MKLFLSILFSLILTNISLSQNDYIVVKYNKKFIKNPSTLTNPVIKQRLESLNQSLNIIEHILIFDKSTSYFTTSNVMNSDGQAFSESAISAGGMADNHLLNIKEKKRLYHTELFEKKFIVSDKYNKYEWELHTETKTILGYRVYKATTKLIIDDIRGSHEQQIEVWYTNSIPSPFGPASFSGLPGLVLEVNFDNKVITYATEVSTTRDKRIIEKFRNFKGKEVTEEEFTEIFNNLIKKISGQE